MPAHSAEMTPSNRDVIIKLGSHHRETTIGATVPDPTARADPVRSPVHSQPPMDRSLRPRSLAPFVGKKDISQAAAPITKPLRHVVDASLSRTGASTACRKDTALQIARPIVGAPNVETSIILLSVTRPNLRMIRGTTEGARSRSVPAKSRHRRIQDQSERPPSATLVLPQRVHSPGNRYSQLLVGLLQAEKCQI